MAGHQQHPHQASAPADADRERLQLQLRLAAQQLDGFFNSAVVGMCILDSQLRYVRINDTLARGNGLPVADHLGRTVREVLPDIMPGLEEMLQSVLSTGEPILNLEVNGQVPGRPGVLCFWITSLFPICDALGKPAAIGAVVVEITERKLAEDKLRDTSQRLQSLSRRLLEAQETERRHIARELHDQFAQVLTALKLNLSAIQGAGSPDPRRLDDSLKIVQSLIDSVRSLSFDLRPPLLDDLGLRAALEAYVRQQAARADLHVRFFSDPNLPRLDPASETACFRVAQEALTNVLRHSRARSASVSLQRCADTLLLTISDDGVGFSVSDVSSRAQNGSNFGWLGMQERVALAGGAFQCQSSPGQGTLIQASFPVRAGQT
jgi:PAS domain S-box-containing protein